MKTVRQLLKEFWIPFLVAAGWTIYIGRFDSPTTNAAGLIAVFGAAFFLSSWATGQFVRVRRQAKVESSLGGVQQHLEKLTTDLEEASSRLVSTVLGGDSFAYLSPSGVDSGNATFVIVHQGEFPLSSLAVRICNLNHFHTDAEQGRPFAHDINFEVGDLAPTMASLVEGVSLPLASGAQDYNIFFSARNGLWFQLLRLREVDGEWKTGWVVFRMIENERSVLRRAIEFGFPTIGDEEFDGHERSPSSTTS